MRTRLAAAFALCPLQCCRSVTLAPALMLLVVTLPLFVSTTEASADVTYEYMGKDFDTIIDATPPAGTYTTSMRVTVSFTVSTPLAPNMPFSRIVDSLLSYSFNDGRNTISTADILNVRVSTNASGAIDHWVVAAGIGDIPYSAGLQLLTISTDNHAIPGDPGGDFGETDVCLPDDCLTTQFDRGSVVGELGTWSLVPEPSTDILLASGLAVLGFRRRPSHARH